MTVEAGVSVSERREQHGGQTLSSVRCSWYDALILLVITEHVLIGSGELFINYLLDWIIVLLPLLQHRLQ